MTSHIPEILAPAGDASSLAAAVAAGTDAVYFGLKHFSARMQAANFSIAEAAAAAEYCRRHDVKVYIAFNTLLKPNETDKAGRLVDRLQKAVQPDALIIQDPGLLDISRQAGFSGELHLSTLANVTHPAGLGIIGRERLVPADRVVLPRELSIDEIKACDAACPEDIGLELFVHGALCYSISGRCWWSSSLGGKSGLRGRCVQPCRRTYKYKNHTESYFSCQDLSLDVLVKTLLPLKSVKAWKIEGRKKGPHYVYYTVSAYKIFRDQGKDPQARKHGLEILERALGRPGTKFHFLPQSPASPVDVEQDTASGLFVGRVSQTPPDKKTKKIGCYLKPRLELLPQDLLRIGSEDQSWHQVVRVPRHIPKGGRFDLKTHPTKPPKSGTPIHLVDRREPELQAVLAEAEKEIASIAKRSKGNITSSFTYKQAKPYAGSGTPNTMTLLGTLPMGKEAKQYSMLGLWLTEKNLRTASKTLYPKIWWWLPPMIGPAEEVGFSRLIGRVLSSKGRNFVLNAPWQIGLFRRPESLSLTAGPFCNIANGAAVEVLRRMGFSAAIVATELGGEDYKALPKQSPLPLGFVLGGSWPVGISRIRPPGLKPGEVVFSPRKEPFFMMKFGPLFWIYPKRKLDFSAYKPELEQAGYSFFVNIEDIGTTQEGEATSIFNWEHGLL